MGYLYLGTASSLGAKPPDPLHPPPLSTIWICHCCEHMPYILHTRYVMVNVDLYSAIITKVSNALDTLVSGEKPGFQTLSKGLVVLLCQEVVQQRVPDHGAVHSECSASNSG